jgi:hypothetical protein
MNQSKFLAGIVLVAATLVCSAAWADRGHGGGHVSLGINLGVPFSPWYYPPYYYPYPPVVAYPNVVAVQPSPPVYVERGVEAAAAPAASSYWYYCPNPQGYYPYVNQCPSGWMTVLPQAPQSAGPR